MVDWLEKTVFDCPDPRVLGAFFAAVSGMRSEAGAREPAFQRVADWVAPGWGDAQRPRRVFADPVGHPFSLVYGRRGEVEGHL